MNIVNKIWIACVWALFALAIIATVIWQDYYFALFAAFIFVSLLTAEVVAGDRALRKLKGKLECN